jgi:hypothetical protein
MAEHPAQSDVDPSDDHHRWRSRFGCYRAPSVDHLLDGLPLLIPVPRVAELLGSSRSAAYWCASNGDLPTTHLGGRVYVVTARLQSMLDSA